jgi:hypothetical protein
MIFLLNCAKLESPANKIIFHPLPFKPSIQKFSMLLFYHKSLYLGLPLGILSRYEINFPYPWIMLRFLSRPPIVTSIFHFGRSKSLVGRRTMRTAVTACLLSRWAPEPFLNSSCALSVIYKLLPYFVTIWIVVSICKLWNLKWAFFHKGPNTPKFFHVSWRVH